MVKTEQQERKATLFLRILLIRIRCLYITPKFDNDLNLKQKFWKVKNVEVDEHHVYENFKQTISFDGERYVTILPFKPSHKPLPDNYKES